PPEPGDEVGQIAGILRRVTHRQTFLSLFVRLVWFCASLDWPSGFTGPSGLIFSGGDFIGPVRNLLSLREFPLGLQPEIDAISMRSAGSLPLPVGAQADGLLGHGLAVRRRLAED